MKEDPDFDNYYCHLLRSRHNVHRMIGDAIRDCVHENVLLIDYVVVHKNPADTNPYYLIQHVTYCKIHLLSACTKLRDW